MKFLFLLLLPSFAFCFPEELIQIRHDIETTSIRYFTDHAHPVSGLVRDKARNFSDTTPENNVSSLAATGFGIAVIAHAAQEGRISHEAAEKQILKTLRYVKNNVPHYKGWLLHFVNWENGKRAWNSEFSTIDTALFLAGALYAAEILHHQEISGLARIIYQRVDFPSAMTDDGQSPGKKTLSLSYSPERGWTKYQWETYAEQAILLILGMGHPTKALPKEAWFAWRRDLMGLHMPLFIHQYSHLFIDFRNFREKIWDAGMRATILHRKMNRHGFWGYSAGESPEGYLVSSPVNFKTTICIGCAVGSAMYAPEMIMRDAYDWREGSFGLRLWGRYGITDSIDIEKKWFSSYVLGITKGPEYLSVQNMEGRTSIWKDFMNIPEIRKALAKIK